MTRWPLPEPMRLALAQAGLAADAGEVPIGAVVVKNGEVIAAALALANERLDDCDLWVTLEPCAMCAGAIVHARIARVYYAAPDPKGGAVANGARVFDQPGCLHRPEVYAGLGEGEAAELLRAFFRERR
jgi:tRNA(adenine34) deaminase